MLAPEGVTTLDVTGGAPPFDVDFASGGDRSGGTFFGVDGGSTVPYRAGVLGDVTDTLQVTDAAGQVSLPLNIAIGPALKLSPPGASVSVGGTFDFTASGGQPPIAFGLSAAPACDAGQEAWPDAGSCLGATGASCILADGQYTSGSTSASSTDWVFALDGNGVCALSPVEVGLALTFANATQVASPGQSLLLVPFGGSPPYQIAFDSHGNLSGGAMSPTGVYTAGPNANLALLRYGPAG
jgi:hypothetical protein